MALIYICRGCQLYIKRDDKSPFENGTVLYRPSLGAENAMSQATAMSRNGSEAKATVSSWAVALCAAGFLAWRSAASPDLKFDNPSWGNCPLPAPRSFPLVQP
ncbi:hypothetical protein BDU57DRAFT_512355 [Ampelomyces quisqualis]|uniref:Uncharacterized protein n=1 Tax=Ampelomyces quisqualis TaxID=50730 RepID=A0A6A5QWV8_AMPQU|nr:hypothetical protein BDU57DRAFT_512355 [Ampelomyces quisqualis]